VRLYCVSALKSMLRSDALTDGGSSDIVSDGMNSSEFSSALEGFPPAKRGRNIADMVLQSKSQIRAMREAVAMWVNRTKDDMRQMLEEHQEQSVKLRADVARYVTEITESNKRVAALEKNQNERVERIEQLKTLVRAEEVNYKDSLKQRMDLETAVASRTGLITKRRSVANKKLTDAEKQIQSVQQLIDLYGARLGLTMEVVPLDSEKGTKVLKVQFTLLNPRKPLAAASCRLFIHNDAFCIDGYEPSKPEGADEIVRELNNNQNLPVAIAKLRAAFKKLLVPSSSSR